MIVCKYSTLGDMTCLTITATDDVWKCGMLGDMTCLTSTATDDVWKCGMLGDMTCLTITATDDSVGTQKYLHEEVRKQKGNL